MMMRRIGFGGLWIGFIVYAVGFAPPDQPETLTLIQHLSSGQWEGINPLIITLFNIMGIWPLIYAALVLIDGRGQRLWAWPFVLGSFGLGAFALLPYLALRQPAPTFSGEKGWLLRGLDSRWLGGAIALGTVILLGYGLTTGDWADFIDQWQTSRFIHVMSLDFCLLCLLFPALLGDDMARRGWQNQRAFWALSLLPLLGAIAYLTLRPPLPVEPAPDSLEPSS